MVFLMPDIWEHHYNIQLIAGNSKEKLNQQLMKVDDVIKIISTVATLLFAASEVLRQARMMKNNEPVTD